MKILKKSIYLLFLIIMSLSVIGTDNYNSDNYNKIQSDSVFVVDVEWQKITNTQFDAYITVDLNYAELMNPVNRFALVETYQWRNWFKPEFSFDDIGENYWYVDENGNTVETFLLKYYYELPDTGTIEDCVDNWRCDEGLPNSRVGFYGLPFYIQELEFMCDVDDNNKGYLAITPDITQKDIVNLIRPNYEGLSSPNISIDLIDVPLGWGMDGGRIIRYSGLPVKCFNMDSTDNSKLYFKLKPNPYYRHFNPDLAGSETWDYNDIISSLPSVSNKESLPFNLDIDFNFTGDFWNYTVTQEESDNMVNNFFGVPDDYELDCDIYVGERLVESLKFSELSSTQQANINTGEAICTGEETIIGCDGLRGTIQCSYPVSPIVTNINEKVNNDYDQAISLQQQTIITAQVDNIDKKLGTKNFITNMIIPFFAFIILMIFYVFELFIIGLFFLGLVPMMFNQFIKGLKDAFSIDDLLKRNYGIKKEVKK